MGGGGGDDGDGDYSHHKFDDDHEQVVLLRASGDGARSSSAEQPPQWPSPRHEHHEAGATSRRRPRGWRRALLLSPAASRGKDERDKGAMVSTVSLREVSSSGDGDETPQQQQQQQERAHATWASSASASTSLRGTKHRHAPETTFRQRAFCNRLAACHNPFHRPQQHAHVRNDDEDDDHDDDGRGIDHGARNGYARASGSQGGAAALARVPEMHLSPPAVSRPSASQSPGSADACAPGDDAAAASVVAGARGVGERGDAGVERAWYHPYAPASSSSSSGSLASSPSSLWSASGAHRPSAVSIPTSTVSSAELDAADEHAVEMLAEWERGRVAGATAAAAPCGPPHAWRPTPLHGGMGGEGTAGGALASFGQSPRCGGAAGGVCDSPLRIPIDALQCNADEGDVLDDDDDHGGNRLEHCEGVHCWSGATPSAGGDADDVGAASRGDCAGLDCHARRRVGRHPSPPSTPPRHHQNCCRRLRGELHSPQLSETPRDASGAERHPSADASLPLHSPRFRFFLLPRMRSAFVLLLLAIAFAFESLPPLASLDPRALRARHFPRYDVNRHTLSDDKAAAALTLPLLHRRRRLFEQLRHAPLQHHDHRGYERAAYDWPWRAVLANVLAIARVYADLCAWRVFSISVLLGVALRVSALTELIIPLYVVCGAWHGTAHWWMAVAACVCGTVAGDCLAALMAWTVRDELMCRANKGEMARLRDARVRCAEQRRFWWCGGDVFAWRASMFPLSVVHRAMTAWCRRFRRRRGRRRRRVMASAEAARDTARSSQCATRYHAERENDRDGSIDHVDADADADDEDNEECAALRWPMLPAWLANLVAPALRISPTAFAVGSAAVAVPEALLFTALVPRLLLSRS